MSAVDKVGASLQWVLDGNDLAGACRDLSNAQTPADGFLAWNNVVQAISSISSGLLPVFQSPGAAAFAGGICAASGIVTLPTNLARANEAFAACGSARGT